MFFIKISLKFVPESPRDNRSSLVQAMTWHLLGAKSLPEPMMIQFTHTDAHMHHHNLKVSWYHKITREIVLTSLTMLTANDTLNNYVKLYGCKATHICRQIDYLIPVLEIPTGSPVRDRQRWRRTGNLLLIFLQFYVYDLRFMAWGPKTFSNTA